MSDLDPYDQYEVSVPLEIAGTCLTEVGHKQPSRLHIYALILHGLVFPASSCCPSQKLRASHSEQTSLSPMYQ